MFDGISYMKLNQANSSPLINYVSTWSIMYQYSLKLLKADHAVLWALMGSDQEIYVWRAWRLSRHLLVLDTHLREMVSQFQKKITKTFRWKVKEIHICCSIYNAKLRGLFTMGTIRWNYFSRKHFRNSKYILWLSDK